MANDCTAGERSVIRRIVLAGSAVAVLAGCGAAPAGGPGPMAPAVQQAPAAQVEAPTDCQVAPHLPACRSGHGEERLPSSL